MTRGLKLICFGAYDSKDFCQPELELEKLDIFAVLEKLRCDNLNSDFVK